MILQARTNDSENIWKVRGEGWWETQSGLSLACIIWSKRFQWIIIWWHRSPQCGPRSISYHSYLPTPLLHILHHLITHIIHIILRISEKFLYSSNKMSVWIKLFFCPTLSSCGMTWSWHRVEARDWSVESNTASSLVEASISIISVIRVSLSTCLGFN